MGMLKKNKEFQAKKQLLLDAKNKVRIFFQKRKKTKVIIEEGIHLSTLVCYKTTSPKVHMI